MADGDGIISRKTPRRSFTVNLSSTRAEREFRRSIVNDWVTYADRRSLSLRQFRSVVRNFPSQDSRGGHVVVGECRSAGAPESWIHLLHLWSGWSNPRADGGAVSAHSVAIRSDRDSSLHLSGRHGRGIARLAGICRCGGNHQHHGAAGRPAGGTNRFPADRRRTSPCE